MTSLLATDAKVKNILGKKFFLEINNAGLPVNKQVPQSIQEYTAAGNETISLNGSNVLFVNSTLAGGNLTVNVSATDMRNLLNREITVVLPSTAGSNLIIDLPAGAEFISAALLEDTNNTYTAVAGTTYVKKLIFLSATRVAVV